MSAIDRQVEVKAREAEFPEYDEISCDYRKLLVGAILEIEQQAPPGPQVWFAHPFLVRWYELVCQGRAALPGATEGAVGASRRLRRRLQAEFEADPTPVTLAA